MNYGIVTKVIGYILIIEALLMIPSFFIALYYGQPDLYAFLICIILILLVGIICAHRNIKDSRIKTKDGLAIVTLGWVLASLFGALPFVISGSIPSFVDALFETVSGFTTTGATVLQDVEALPKGLLFWRSLTHWIGGMGILVFTLALLPAIGVGSFYIFKAETPGPTVDKIVPRLKETAKILYIVYLVLTILQIILLRVGGMPLYDSIVHTFGTVGTGGFSIKNASIGAYNSNYIHIIIGIFMVLSGVNFSLYFTLIRGKVKEFLKSEELRLYILIVFGAIVLICINLFSTSYTDIGLALKDAFFQVSSIITTTGYATVDFDLWPAFSKSILLILMFIGGCAGSTTGSVKIIRVLVLGKLIKREVGKILHPRAIIPIKVGGNSVSGDTIVGITSFFILYMILFAASTIIISLEGFDMESTVSAVAATLGNVGPGFGVVGPKRNFSVFSDFSKLLFSVLMLLGRLEIYTVIALITPRAWKEK